MVRELLSQDLIDRIANEAVEAILEAGRANARRWSLGRSP
jgi:hypothetical protein